LDKKEIRNKKLEKNPFITDNFEIVIFEIASNVSYRNVSPEGEDPIWLPNIEDRESDTYVRFYLKDAGDIDSLPINSQAILWWVLRETVAGRDHVLINVGRCLKVRNISMSTYRRAMKGLEDGGFLEKIKSFGELGEDVYWMNPKYFFNGSRVKKYKNKTIKHDKRKKDKGVNGGSSE
jgi:hypothetical protein